LEIRGWKIKNYKSYWLSALKAA